MNYTHLEIASSLALWNEYFNVDAAMTDEEFQEMTLAERVALLDEAFGSDSSES